MKALPHATIALALFAGGAWGGRAIRTGTPEAPIPSAEVRKSSAAREEEKEPKRNLKSLLASRQADARAPGKLRSSLERVDTATLKSIAVEQYTILAGMTEGGKKRQPHQDLYTAAVDELWQRRGIAAFEWADSLEPKERATLTKSLLRRALQEDPASALPWMNKYHAEQGKSATINEFLAIAMKGAAERGVDEVIRAYGMFEGADLSNPLRNASYPEDFDFAKLHASFSGKLGLSEAVSRWAMRDRDAASTAVRESLLQAGKYEHYHSESLHTLMAAAMAQDGEIAGVEWTVAQLSSLSAQRRKEYLWSLSRRNDFSAEGRAATITSLPPAERAEYVLGLLKISNAALSYEALDTLPRAELLKVLHKDIVSSGDSTEDYSGTGGLSDLNRIRQEVQERYQLTPGEISSIQTGR